MPVGNTVTGTNHRPLISTHRADGTRGCVTPKVIHNFIEATEHDTRLIDGLDELCEESKAKVLRAYEQGKVADEDWRHVRSSCL